ncbi:hypothetical protein EDD15DRAFT_2379186 [Pisolithus albus]|nr:hypothetical protein EDD15DRAFT_2379186 [Pisolithus albus]
MVKFHSGSQGYKSSMCIDAPRKGNSYFKWYNSCKPLLHQISVSGCVDGRWKKLFDPLQTFGWVTGEGTDATPRHALSGSQLS